MSAIRAAKFFYMPLRLQGLFAGVPGGGETAHPDPSQQFTNAPLVIFNPKFGCKARFQIRTTPTNHAVFLPVGTAQHHRLKCLKLLI